MGRSDGHLPLVDGTPGAEADEAAKQTYRWLTGPKQSSLDQVAAPAEASNGAHGAGEPRTRTSVLELGQGSTQERYLPCTPADGSGTKVSQAPLTRRASAPSRNRDDRRRLERDLHDGVQNELVALIANLAIARQHGDTTPALAHLLERLEARAQTALDSVRTIARGIYPALLGDFGLAEALRAQARRAAINATVLGSPPRGGEEHEEAAYFTCTEAIQNAAKHAGHGVRVTLRLYYESQTLVVAVTDDGCGFSQARTPAGSGLQNIHDRILELGGTLSVASEPGRGTALTFSLPWPSRADQVR